MTINLLELEKQAQEFVGLDVTSELMVSLISITRSAQSILSHIDHGDGDWTKIVGELREKLKGVEA